MALNKFPSYEELRRSSIQHGDNILEIIERPIKDGDIYEISGYPGTGKTLISGMKFSQCSGPKLYLTYAHMLVAYTRQGLGVKGNIYVLDKWLHNHYNSEFNGSTSIDEKRQKWIKELNKDEHGTILFVDEVQDIAPKDIAQLTLKFDKVVICGDRDQIIFETSNAGIDFFHEYEKALEMLEPNLRAKHRIIGPTELKKNYRNTKPVFDFAKCFHHDSSRINDIEIMKQGGEKPELWLGTTDKLYEGVIDYCVNEIDSQNVVAIIAGSKEDIVEIKGKICKGLQERLGDEYDDELVQSYISDGKSGEKEILSEKCMNASVVISSVYSMKGLEADDVIIWKTGRSSYWKNDSVSKNKYYVGFTRSRNNLIICQNEGRFGPYNVPDDLYNVRNLDSEQGSEEDDDGEDRGFLF